MPPLQRRTRSRDSTETAGGILPLRLLRSRSRVSSPAMGNNLGRVAAEYPHLRKIGVFEPGERVETHGFEHMHRAVAAKRRMIFFSGHIANWEIAALAAVQYGISVAQIYRAANNPLVEGPTEILPPVGAISKHPARLYRPSRQASRAHSRGKPGFLTYESGFGGDGLAAGGSRIRTSGPSNQSSSAVLTWSQTSGVLGKSESQTPAALLPSPQARSPTRTR
jgi:hypothetical protein